MANESNLSKPNRSGKVPNSDVGGPLPMHWRLKTGKDVMTKPQGVAISKVPSVSNGSKT